MKSVFTSLLIVSFVSIAVFGIFGMHAGMQDHGGECIAATAQGTDCPKQANPVEYLTFHLDAFRDFSTATFGDIATSLLILSLLIIGIVFGGLRGNLAPPRLAYSQIRRSDSFRPPSQYGLIRWLALHENSPATP